MPAMREIALIGVPVDLGAGRRGVDLGPGAIRYAGLKDRLEALGHRVRDLGNVQVALLDQIALPAPGEPLRYLEPLVAMNRALGACVAEVVAAGQFPLVLGGDHSLAIGSIGGAAAGRPIGVIWLDAHGDFNTDETTPSGNIHGMSLAALTGRGHPALTQLMGPEPVLQDTHVALVGVRSLDDLERDALRASGVHAYTMHDIDRRGMGTVMEEAIRLVSRNTAGIHVSFDLDALDPNEAPGVGTAMIGGLSYREAHLAMEMVHASDRLISMDLVEVNPILDNHNLTAELAVDLALSALGKRVL
jgi:arginase